MIFCSISSQLDYRWARIEGLSLYGWPPSATHHFIGIDPFLHAHKQKKNTSVSKPYKQ